MDCTSDGCPHPASCTVIWQTGGYWKDKEVAFCESHYNLHHSIAPHQMSDYRSIDDYLTTEDFWKELES